MSVGNGADWLLPEFWRPGSGHEVDLKLLKAVSTPHLVDDVGHWRGRPLAWPVTEQDRMDAALFVLAVHRPDLLLLHLFDLDGVQHERGPMTPEALRAVEEADANLGRLLAALEKSGALFVVVSDHGFLPVSRQLRPNVLLRSAGLITVGADGKPTDWRASFHANGGTATLRLKDPDDAEARSRALSLFEAKLHEPASGLQRILSASEAASLGGVEEGAFVLDAATGFYFSGSLEGEWSNPSPSRGYHGYAPDRPEMTSSFLVLGPGLARRGDLGVIRMTEIAPAIAGYLGLSLGPETGSPLPIFEPPAKP